MNTLAAKPAEQSEGKRGGHTPGPWHRRIGRKGDGGDRSQEEQLCNEAGVAALLILHDGSPEGEANARVAAAAPDLLEALKIARDCIAYCRRAHKDAQSGTGFPVEIILDDVIARATGAA